MGEGAWELMGAMRQIGMALFQLTHSGREAQQEAAKDVLAETRRSLYRILAEEPGEPLRTRGPRREWPKGSARQR